MDRRKYQHILSEVIWGKRVLYFSLISSALVLAIFLLSVTNNYGDSQHSHVVSEASERVGRGTATDQKVQGQEQFMNKLAPYTR